MEPFSMLQLLLSENQFELIFPETDNATPSTIRLVYLMNDAVESFLLFHNARLTGTYDPAYEGELDALLTQDENRRYALIVHQGGSVVTLFFEDLTLENHYYDYSQIGHFWMKGYEYLRQLEYRIAILRDKLDYLGEESCSTEERELAALTEFPPLNVCCYPAVPEKYRVVRKNPWHLSEDASRVFQSIAIEAGDPKLLHRPDRPELLALDLLLILGEHHLRILLRQLDQPLFLAHLWHDKAHLLSPARRQEAGDNLRVL